MSIAIIYLVTAIQSEREESNDSRRFSVFSLKSLFLSINVICSFKLASFPVPWFSGECEFIVKLLDKIKAFSKMNSSFWSPPILCSLSIILMHYVTKIDSKINHGYEIEMQFGLNTIFSKRVINLQLDRICVIHILWRLTWSMKNSG